MLAVFLSLAHLTACLWWAVGRLGLDQHDAHATSWIERAETPALRYNGLDQQYFSSIYWSLTCLLKSERARRHRVLQRLVTVRNGGYRGVTGCNSGEQWGTVGNSGEQWGIVGNSA